MQSLLVVAHSRFHQQSANLVLHLHHLPDQQVAVPQRASTFANRGRGHVALRQKIAPQTVANLARVNAIVLLFRRRNGPQHQRVRHLQHGGMGLQVIVDPSGDPAVQVKSCGGKRTFLRECREP
ncbi:MAG: hypothetical protein JWO71_584 [Candidatus Acidoferrum typicum]|nr:hypothetical protein [Candidatus Acidoferrum typicum]